MTLARRPSDRGAIPFRSALERLMTDWPVFQWEGYSELAPPVDVQETNDAYIVEIDLPGANPEDTEVLVEGRTLTVKGRFTEEKEESQGNYLVKERRRGQFMRAVALPDMVDIDRVTSRFENGQLTISLPKASQNRARRIEINSSSGSQRSDVSNQRSGNGNQRKK